MTNFKYSQLYHDMYPGVFDGWYETGNGGNFYYGIQTGVSFGRSDVTVRAGKIITQDFKTTPLMPFYGQLGYTVKF